MSMNWLEEKWYALNTGLSTKNASVFCTLGHLVNSRVPDPPAKAGGSGTLAKPLVAQSLSSVSLSPFKPSRNTKTGGNRLSMTSLQVLTKDATKIYKVSRTACFLKLCVWLKAALWKKNLMPFSKSAPLKTPKTTLTFFAKKICVEWCDLLRRIFFSNNVHTGQQNDKKIFLVF